MMSIPSSSSCEPCADGHQPNKNCWMNNQPDLVALLLSFFSLKELIGVDSVSKLWNSVAEERIWSEMARRRDVNLLTFKKRRDMSNQREYVVRSMTTNIKRRNVLSGIYIFGGTFESTEYTNLVRIEDNESGLVLKHVDSSGIHSLGIGATASTIANDGQIVAIGGWWHDNDCSIRNVTKLSITTPSPEDISQPHQPQYVLGQLMERNICFAAATTTIDGHIIITGGGDTPYRGSPVYDNCAIQKYTDDSSFVEQPWTPLPSMNTVRCGHSCMSMFDDSVVVCGGYAGGTNYLQCAERLDWGTGGWISLPSMTDKRSGAAAGLGPDGCIYVTGGSPDGCKGHKSTERLDLRVRKWEVLAPMKFGRGYTSGTFARNGQFYVCGGLDKINTNVEDERTETQKSMECYDVRTGTWRLLEPITTADYSATTATTAATYTTSSTINAGINTSSHYNQSITDISAVQSPSSSLPSSNTQPAVPIFDKKFFSRSGHSMVFVL